MLKNVTISTLFTATTSNSLCNANIGIWFILCLYKQVTVTKRHRVWTVWKYSWCNIFWCQWLIEYLYSVELRTIENSRPSAADCFTVGWCFAPKCGFSIIKSLAGNDSISTRVGVIHLFSVDMHAFFQPCFSPYSHA